MLRQRSDLDPAWSEVPADYRVASTSERVVNVILSTAGSHRQWSGLR